MTLRFLVCVGFLVLAPLGCRAARDALPEPPPLPREMRGVWVASVSNIDWPSRPGLSEEQQRAEAIAILDRAASLRLNTIILQVRPAADALYPSELEPWSYYLTGEQGKPPGYDPLAFWIEEAHARGMELHAWINPFRVRPAASYELHESSIARTHPSAVKEYGEPGKTQLWMDPAHPAARRRTLAVVRDLVKRYDLDGLHIDDYFYPYPVTGHDFPDAETYARYQRRGGKLARDDFRRAQIDSLVREMHRLIQREKRHVKFGISPFGIWRPGHPAGIAGMDQYAAIFADARKWLREGWCDYFTPQLYWPIARHQQSFPLLLAWWARENVKGRTLAPGLFTSRVLPTEQDWPAEEIVGQVLVTRGQTLYSGEAGGHVHFSMKALSANTKGLIDALREKVYTGAAVSPAMTWIDRRPPRPPRVKVIDGRTDATTHVAVLRIAVMPGSRERPRWWTVQVLVDGKWELAAVSPGGEREVLVPVDALPRGVAVRALDVAGNESRADVIRSGVP